MLPGSTIQLMKVAISSSLQPDKAKKYSTVCSKASADARGLRASFVGEIPLCATVAEREFRWVAHSGRDGMPHESDELS